MAPAAGCRPCADCRYVLRRELRRRSRGTAHQVILTSDFAGAEHSRPLVFPHRLLEPTPRAGRAARSCCGAPRRREAGVSQWRATGMNVLELNAFTVFLAIAAIGFLFLIVSLFFGGILDHFDATFDASMDHGGPGFFS